LSGAAREILARRLRVPPLERRNEPPPNQPPLSRCGAGRCGAPPKPPKPKLKNCAEAGPAIPTSIAVATASATSRPGSVNTRKEGFGFGSIELSRNRS
jgi:hypothetical protein